MENFTTCSRLDAVLSGMQVGKKTGTHEYELSQGGTVIPGTLRFSRCVPRGPSLWVRNIRRFVRLAPANPDPPLFSTYRSVQQFLLPFMLGKKIGEGGNGTVHRIRGLRHQVVKIVEGKKLTEASMYQRLAGHCALMLDYALVEGATAGLCGLFLAKRKINETHK